MFENAQENTIVEMVSCIDGEKACNDGVSTRGGAERHAGALHGRAAAAPPELVSLGQRDDGALCGRQWLA